MSLVTTAIAMSSGQNAVTGSGAEWDVAFSGTWRECDRPNLVLTNGDGTQYTFGAGDTTGVEASFCFTFNDKLYVLGGPTFYFSAIGEPEVFNDPNATGNGFVTVTNFYSAPEDLVAMAHYQGRLAFFSRTTTHIWQVNADPTLYNQVQLLENVGTFAKLSVQSLGDLDVLFLHDSGIRSLRVRDSSLNAFVVDIGSPIDGLIQAKLAECTDEEKQAACSVVEVASNRYWLFLKDTIYVLSYFPMNKITAWSTYDPTYGDGQTPFVPEKMVTFNGRVYIRGDDDALYLYGGTDGATYDSAQAVVETPWLDAGKPATMKQSTAVDVAIVGTWSIKVGMDYFVDELVDLGQVSETTFDYRRLGVNSRGTHFKMRMETTGSEAASLSSLLFQFNSEEK